MPSSRRRGLPARWRLTLAFTAVAAVSAALLWAVAVLFAIRYVPEGALVLQGPRGWAPDKRDITRAFVPRATVAWVGIVALSFAISWWLSGRLLRPIARMDAVVTAVSNGDTSARVRLPGAADEFTSVADALDTMLDRIQAESQRQQQFAADASHELRTPLAITRSLLEVAAADPDVDTKRLVSQLSVVNDRAVDAANALLLLSRIATQTVPLEPIDLALVVEETVEDLTPLAERAGVELQDELSPSIISGERELLRRLVANLVHNAIVHNSPKLADARVWLRTVPTADGAVLRISNTGPQLTRAEVVAALEPFHRGKTAPSRADEAHTGAGLGLALCARIVEALHGRLELTPRVGGGLDAEVWLPK